MDERLFARLALRLRDEPVVLASVLATSGATPRKPGSRMLVIAQDAEFSIGGGAAEARVIAAARVLLAAGESTSEVFIDLRGGPETDGICGGRMRIALRRWVGAADRALADDLAARLAAGMPVTLPASAIGAAAEPAPLHPNERLLIVGAGHCGQALFELARHLDFDLWVFDQRPECFTGNRFSGARQLCGEAGLLRETLATERPVFAVLLSRDFQRDLDALCVLAEAPPAFLGMMGSARRVAEVRAALPPAAAALAITAPVGLPIGEQSPHEIAVAILAQLVQRRRGDDSRSASWAVTALR